MTHKLRQRRPERLKLHQLPLYVQHLQRNTETLEGLILYTPGRRHTRDWVIRIRISFSVSISIRIRITFSSSIRIRIRFRIRIRIGVGFMVRVPEIRLKARFKS